MTTLGQNTSVDTSTVVKGVSILDTPFYFATSGRKIINLCMINESKNMICTQHVHCVLFCKIKDSTKSVLNSIPAIFLCVNFVLFCLKSLDI